MIILLNSVLKNKHFLQKDYVVIYYLISLEQQHCVLDLIDLLIQI